MGEHAVAEDTPRTVCECGGEVTQGAFGFEGEWHDKETWRQRKGYSISEIGFIDEDGNAVILLEEQLPPLTNVWVTYDESFAMEHEPDWIDFCESCGEL